MGLSASQARMLQLTARRSDIEYQMQQIASARLDLTNQMTEISENYNNALNDRILYYQESGINSSKNKVQLTHMHLIQQGYEVRDTTTGEVVKPILNVNLTDIDLSNSTLQSVLGNATSQTALYVLGENGEQMSFNQENLTNAGYGVRITEAGTAAGKTEIKDEDLESGIREGLYTLTDLETGEDINYKTASDIHEDTRIVAQLETIGGKFYFINDTTKVQVLFGATDDEGKSKAEGYDEADNILYLNWDKMQKTNLIDADNLDTGLREGRYEIVIPTGDDKYQEYDWTTSTFILDELDTSNDGAAVATYDVESAEAQAKDKTLELKLKNLENEHKAVETEIESVQKVITKNIEGSFKIFV